MEESKSGFPAGMTTKRGEGKGNGRSRFPAGMTAKRGRGKGNGRSRFPAGMTTNLQRRGRGEGEGEKEGIPIGMTEGDARGGRERMLGQGWVVRGVVVRAWRAARGMGR